MRKIAYILLCLVMMVTAVACNAEEKATQTATFEETAEAGISDREALDAFFAKFRAGDYEKEIFDYDDYLQFVELGEYEGIEYPADELLDGVVTDEDVDDYLTGIQVVGIIPESDFETLTEGTVQKFDTVKIDFYGLVDGEKDEGATGEDQELLIGSNSYITGFETGLIGAKVGEEVVLTLRFSPYYQAADVAGKEVIYHVTVKEITRPKNIPELKVEDINKLYGSSFANMEEVWNDIQSYLKQQKESQAYEALSTYLEDKLVENATFKTLPEKELKHFEDYYVTYYTSEKDAEQSVEDFVKEELEVTYEEFLADAKGYAEVCVKAEIVMRAMIQVMEVEVTDEQMESLIVGLYQSQGSYYYADLNSFLTDYVNAYGEDVFWREVAGQTVMEKLSESAVKIGE